MLRNLRDSGSVERLNSTKRPVTNMQRRRAIRGLELFDRSLTENMLQVEKKTLEKTNTNRVAKVTGCSETRPLLAGITHDDLKRKETPPAGNRKTGRNYNWPGKRPGTTQG